MALGKTSLKQTDNIDTLLGRSAEPKKVSTATKAAKLTDEEVERYPLVHGDEIKEIVKKKRSYFIHRIINNYTILQIYQ